MTLVNVFQAKTDLSKLIASLENREEDEIVIARGKTPVAVLSLYKKPKKIKLGAYNGKFPIPDDIDDCNDEVLQIMLGGESL